MTAGLREQCPNETSLLDFVEKRLGAEAEAAIDAHLDSCSSCRQWLAELAKAGVLSQPVDATVASEKSEPHDRETEWTTTGGDRPVIAPAPARLGPQGRYRVDDLLGQGGMGRVFRGFDTQLMRAVAVKLVRPTGKETAPAAAARLLREAQVVASVRHPNVVNVHDVGVEGDEVFVVMELVEGQSAELWARGRGFREVAQMMLEAGEGLCAVHRAGLIHRDFKPSNVLVGKDGVPRLADFGIASSVHESSETRPGLGLRAGTPAYMSPEQKSGQPLDARSDQFSFAVSMWKTVHGRAPPDASVEVPAALNRVLRRGMAVQPTERFESVEALLRAARSALDVRRRRAIAGAALASFGLVAAGWFAFAARTPSGLEQGLEALWHHELNVARDRFNEAAALKPTDVEVHYYLAWLHWWHGDEPQALDAVHTARALSPASPRKESLDALESLIAGKRQLAAEQFARLVAVHPQQIDLRYGVFEALFHHGQLDASLEHYRRICDQKADFSLGLDHLFDVYAARGDQAGLNWVLEHPFVKGHFQFPARYVRSRFALRDYAGVIAYAQKGLEGVPPGARADAIEPQRAAMFQAQLVTGHRAAAAELSRGALRERLVLDLMLSEAGAAEKLQPLLSDVRGPLQGSGLQDWLDAIALAVPLEDAELLRRLGDAPLSPAAEHQPRVLTARQWVGNGKGAPGPHAELTREAEEVGAALRAEAAGDWAAAISAWRNAHGLSAGGTFSISEAFRWAAAARRQGDVEAMVAACQMVVTPRVFQWSFATAAPKCARWMIEAAQAKGDAQSVVELSALRERWAGRR